MALGFLGEHAYRVDAKGRIPLPPAFREAFARQGGVLTEGLDDCLCLYPLSEWEKLQTEYAELPDNREKHRDLRRFYFSGAFPTELDRQGRITLPPSLREFAGIRDDAVIIGMSRFVEIWSLEQWTERKKRVRERAWQNSESLEQQT